MTACTLAMAVVIGCAKEEAVAADDDVDGDRTAHAVATVDDEEDTTVAAAGAALGPSCVAVVAVVAKPLVADAAAFLLSADRIYGILFSFLVHFKKFYFYGCLHSSSD